MAVSKPPRPGCPKSVPVKLSYDLALNLWAYQQANSGALQGQVLCDALEFFLKERLRESPQMEARFQEFRSLQLKPAAQVVRLVARGGRRRRSSGGER